MLGGQFGVKPI